MMNKAYNSYTMWISVRHLGFPVEGGIGERHRHRLNACPENMGVAAGILSMSSVELDKSVGGNFTLPGWLRTCVYVCIRTLIHIAVLLMI